MAIDWDAIVSRRPAQMQEAPAVLLHGKCLECGTPIRIHGGSMPGRRREYCGKSCTARRYHREVVRPRQRREAQERKGRAA